MGKGQLEAGVSDCKQSGPRPPASAPSSVDCGGSGSGAPPSMGVPGGSAGKTPPSTQQTVARFLGREDPLEKGQAARSSVLGLPCGSAGKESSALQETPVQPLGWGDPLEKE